MYDQGSRGHVKSAEDTKPQERSKEYSSKNSELFKFSCFVSLDYDPFLIFKGVGGRYAHLSLQDFYRCEARTKIRPN